MHKADWSLELELTSRSLLVAEEELHEERADLLRGGEGRCNVDPVDLANGQMRVAAIGDEGSKPGALAFHGRENLGTIDGRLTLDVDEVMPLVVVLSVGENVDHEGVFGPNGHSLDRVDDRIEREVISVELFDFEHGLGDLGVEHSEDVMHALFCSSANGLIQRIAGNEDADLGCGSLSWRGQRQGESCQQDEKPAPNGREFERSHE